MNEMENMSFLELKDALKGNMKILWLSANAGVGGCMSGIDSSLFPGVLDHLRQNSKVFKDKSWATTLSTSKTGAAIFGAGLSWCVSDKFGRKKGIMAADCLFFVGSILVIWCKSPWLALACRVLVGLGIGMNSVSCSVYVSEFAPAKIRGSLVNLNGVMLSCGHFVAYVINQMILKSAGLYWMLVVGCLPAALQFIIMFKLPESPQWQKKPEAARRVASNFVNDDQPVEFEVDLEQSEVCVSSDEDNDSSKNIVQRAFQSLKSTSFRKAVFLCLVVQLSCVLGADSVSYHGQFEENVEVPLLTCFLDLFGSLLSTISVDKYGRRRLITCSVVALAIIFHGLSYSYASPSNKGMNEEPHLFPFDKGCPGYTAVNDCTMCLTLNCGFCAISGTQYGTCMINDNSTLTECKESGKDWIIKYCPGTRTNWKKSLIALYRLVHSTGLATTPALVALEIFPLKELAFGGALSVMIGYIFKLLGFPVVSSLSHYQGIPEIYMGYAILSWLVALLIFIFIPETQGVPLEEMETTVL